MFKSIKIRLILLLSILFVFTITITLSFFWYEAKRIEMSTINTTMLRINENFRTCQRQQENLNEYATIDSDFYKDNRYQLIVEYKKNFDNSIESLKNLKYLLKKEENSLKDNLDSLVSLSNQHRSLFDSLVFLYKIRGFKDFGLNGQFRDYIHKIEQNAQKEDQVLLLTIRRHEKDYMLRKEMVYIDDLKSTVSQLKSNIIKSSLPRIEKDLFVGYLEKYVTIMDSIVNIENRIGIKTGAGIKGQIKAINDQIDEKITYITSYMEHKLQIVSKELRLAFIIILLIGGIINVITIYYIVRRIAFPITLLSHSIHEVIKSDFSDEKIIHIIRAQDEIGRLSDDVSYMLRKLKEKTNEVIRKNHSITKKSEELKAANEEILAANEELEQQKEEIMVINEELTKQKNDLQELLIENKRAQKRLLETEKMASIGQLTAGIAHEINNPVNYVYAGIDSLKMNFEEIKQLLIQYEHVSNNHFPENFKIIKEYKTKIQYNEMIKETDCLIQSIKNGAKRTSDIVRELRLFSRMDEDHASMLNINESIETNLVLLSGIIRPGIEIIKEFETLPPVKCYAGKISQVFMNILSNAIQAIDYDGIITIKTFLKGDKVKISVADTGVGMDAETKKRIFEPFFTTKPVGKGVGLGLSIVYSIIEKHHGRILVESEPNKGATFTITLPLETE